jgi:uncharacterized protein (DUF1697 family)
MNTYVALLKGINVGGKNLIKMQTLIESFESLGLKGVRSYIQCGNIVFESKEAASEKLRRKIEKQLGKTFGHDAHVILKTVSDLESLIRQNPFRRIATNRDTMLCVAFLANAPTAKPKLPLQSQTEKLELIAIKDQAAFVVARRKQTGWFGFPNNFVEKELGVLATTRQWSTVGKIVQFATGTAGGSPAHVVSKQASRLRSH